MFLCFSVSYPSRTIQYSKSASNPRSEFVIRISGFYLVFMDFVTQFGKGVCHNNRYFNVPSRENQMPHQPCPGAVLIKNLTNSQGKPKLKQREDPKNQQLDSFDHILPSLMNSIIPPPPQKNLVPINRSITINCA